VTPDLPPLRAPARKRGRVGIVQLGLGAFFRAHGAIYIAESMAKSGGDWDIIGVSLRHPTQRDLLKPQGFAYTAVELAPGGGRAQIIDVIEDILVPPENPAAVLAAMSDASVRIVTLTVTEKGYCHDPATGALNRAHPDIVHDLRHDLPRSAPGFLVRALQLRRAAGLAPFTVLSCDNLPGNGTVVRGVVSEFAALIDPALADWIAQNGAFPSAMVDRIVPATKPADVTALAERTGVLDLSPVMHEPFRQWVIEDVFVGSARPDLAAVGVQMVADVTPYEHMKLRCLNGTHSSLAYLGYLAGYETIFDTVSDPAFAAFCRHLWRDEIIPGLQPPERINLPDYTEALFARYSNPAIRHLTWQIAMDGSQKLPQRILATIASNLAAGRRSPGLILAVAGWMRYVGGIDENGRKIDVSDPLADRLKSLSDRVTDAAGKVDALLSVREVFDETLAGDRRFRDPLVATFANLTKRGAQACVTEISHD